MGRAKPDPYAADAQKQAAIDEKASQILTQLTSNPRLLAAAERHRYAEPLPHLCRRFATSERTAAKAFKKLLTHLEYRDRHNVHQLSLQSARDVFNNESARTAYNRMMPHGYLGRDRKGQPVLYKLLGRLQLTQLTKAGADLSVTLRYNEWLMERLCGAMNHCGQWTIIIDMKVRARGTGALIQLHISSLSHVSILSFSLSLFRTGHQRRAYHVAQMGIIHPINGRARCGALPRPIGQAIHDQRA